MLRFILCLAVGSVIGFGLASCTAKPVCTSSAQCQPTQRCLPSGLCARTCTKQADCLSTEKCSSSGGCVSLSGGCGSNSDCSVGQTCQSGGICGSSGSGGGTGNGGGTGFDEGGGGGMGQGGGQCGETFTSTGVGANLMIVLDKSRSMDQSVAGVKKWAAATSAVNQMTSTNSSIHFGLEMFSANQECSAGSIVVPIGANTAAAIQSALPASADGSKTQIAGGITVGGTDTALADLTRSNGIVLITDGMQNCNGTTFVGEQGNIDDPVAAVQTLFARNPSVRTWVVGFGSVGGSDGVDPVKLTDMAVKGGTARLTTPRYYQANVPADLQAALAAISNAAQGCSFKLTQTPSDLSKLFIAISGQLVPRDTTRVSGWDFDPATNMVTLYGPACDALANTPGAKLSVQYGCSDGFIEGGGDGGFDFGLDAGQIG